MEKAYGTIHIKNAPTPACFPFIFGLFIQTLQFLQQINVKKCLRRQD